MEVARIKKYRLPGYPNRPAAEKEPILLASIPSRWQKKPLVLAALSSLVGMTAACRMNPSQSNEGGKRPKPVSLVAPLFVHGEGRGVFGCKAINPPAFLSEDEARAAVIEEAKLAGINFEKGGPKIPGVTMTYHDQKATNGTEPLRADGIDRRRGISFIVVSEQDAGRWGRQSLSTVEAMDAKGIAAGITDKLKKVGSKGVVATFYEPFVSPHHTGAGREKDRTEARAEDIQELRKQVRDFVKWLKTQGVI